MEMITDITKIVGKTVKSATLVDYDSVLGLIFTDDTYCMYKVNNNFGCVYLQIETKVESQIQLEIGVITEEEYQNRKKVERQIELDRIEVNERKELAELKRKYEGN